VPAIGAGTLGANLFQRVRARTPLPAATLVRVVASVKGYVLETQAQFDIMPPLCSRYWNRSFGGLMLKAYPVPSVTRAFKIMELLSESKRGLAPSDISRKLALPKSSVHLLVKTLESMGYLKLNQFNGRYHFGLKLVSLSHTALENLDLCEQARPYLLDLMRATGLTVHMAILERAEAVIIEKVEAPGMLRLATWVGRRLDANSSGVGKALLAFVPDASLDSGLSGRALVRHNRNTITSPTKLAAELKKIRQMGYSFEDEEGEIGFRCIGAPVYDASGTVISAISVAGTNAQIPKERVPKLASAVKATAYEISARLGYDFNSGRAS
jgi:DNA-binding IclR family transcriptional regulator